MKFAFSSIAALLLLTFSSTHAAQPSVSPGYIHLFVKGGWGHDRDIWIYPDDTISVREYDFPDRKTSHVRTASKSGLYFDILKQIDSFDLWSSTTSDLEHEVDNARKRAQIESIGITDQDHFYLEVIASGKSLKLDYYAPEFYAGRFPSATSMKSFSRLVRSINKNTIRP